ncbi:hypothetical protein BK653_26315 [Pseudomonas brassicacearum]|uniref:DUF3426 domain-containing protein n=1 Tax=Pseudomonas brassicacearum TaxID=930166 RepID=UPI000F4ADE64|nr:DUF3426 domain-containing protein [Pseudomonas brassicacearum]ROM63567.1 hypothetical protein BK653_22250 [Pseudomonas brassicacearum]ROM64343.1 hypothetical protein BK653_26315 [Pseudomonas brassicacearum]
MTDSFVTQCPHCHTSFRVSHTQLSVARGVVRCGSCLQVFNAARQLLEQRATKETVTPLAPPIKSPGVEAPPRAISQKQWTAAELDLDDLDKELARLERRDKRAPDTFGRRREDNLSAQRDPLSNEQEPWSDSLYSESPAERAETLIQPPVEPFEPHEPARPPRTEPSLSLALEPLEPEDEPVTPLRLEPEDEPPEHLERLSATDDHDDEPVQSAPLRKSRERHEPGLRAEALHDLDDDPLQLDWRKRRSPWGRRLLWGLLILLAAAALGGQYIAYHFEELARQDQYRPWFLQICPTIGCDVPSKVDIAKIKSSNLVVRSHPEFSGALVVDAIIYNRAPFSQPFPLLELRFADLNGHLIASRRFKPGEYLGGDLEGRGEMPPQTPIHIALDILDPGSKAVNYSLSFHSPE